LGLSNPAHEPSIEVKARHANVFFDADWEAMEWADGLLVFGVVLIEACGT
jgi:hypothetical protein